MCECSAQRKVFARNWEENEKMREKKASETNSINQTRIITYVAHSVMIRRFLSLGECPETEFAIGAAWKVPIEHRTNYSLIGNKDVSPQSAWGK